MIGAHLRKRYSFPQSILKTFHSQGPDKDQQSNGSRYNRFEVNQCKIANGENKITLPKLDIS